MEIKPMCFTTDNFFFIKPDGTYLPCCYASSTRVLRKMLGEELYQELNLTNHSFDEVINSNAWKRIIEIVSSDSPPQFCQTICSKPANRIPDQEKTIWDGLNKQRRFT